MLINSRTILLKLDLRIKCCKLLKRSKTTFKSSCYCHVSWDTLYLIFRFGCVVLVGLLLDLLVLNLKASKLQIKYRLHSTLNNFIKIFNIFFHFGLSSKSDYNTLSFLAKRIIFILFIKTF